jgi:hypothetical protein
VIARSALAPADILAAKRRRQYRDPVRAEHYKDTRLGSVADRADRDKTLAEDSFRTVGRRWSHTCPGNAADRPGMNKALAADSHQVLRRACRVDRGKNLVVNSPQLRCRRADRDRTLTEDSSPVGRCRSHTRPDSVADWPDVNRELAVDSQVAAAAEHTARPHCQLNLQVQAGSEQRSICQAREHLSGLQSRMPETFGSMKA